MSSTIFTHPINANIGNLGYGAVEADIKSISVRDVCWKVLSDHGERSTVGAIQAYSDIFQSAFGPHNVHFYPLNVTRISFTEAWRRDHVMSDDTIVTYHPVRNE